MVNHQWPSPVTFFELKGATALNYLSKHQFNLTFYPYAPLTQKHFPLLDLVLAIFARKIVKVVSLLPYILQYFSFECLLRTQIPQDSFLV